MGNTLREKICSAVQEATVFSILADETKDASKVAIVLHYVSLNTFSVYEHFLTYIPAESLTAEGISGYILDALAKHHLDPKCIVSQGYGDERGIYWCSNTHKGSSSLCSLCAL